mmetsp:Transcript_46274/g.75513  ORF Transcript_46274/g.75513 Transcript_46274/m.75513 type:complete len:86 (+) Transcript_46274:1118-1375(+)
MIHALGETGTGNGIALPQGEMTVTEETIVTEETNVGAPVSETDGMIGTGAVKQMWIPGGQVSVLVTQAPHVICGASLMTGREDNQ